MRLKPIFYSIFIAENLRGDHKESILMFNEKLNRSNSSKANSLGNLEIYQKIFKQECVPQHLKALKKHCEDVLKICLGGLLVRMSVDDFILLHGK